MRRSGINRYRIATTEAGLAKGLLFVTGLPAPSSAPYRDHSKVVTKSDGSNQEYGYKNITFLWDRLTATQVKTLRDVVSSARSGSGLLFLTIDRGDGTGVDNDWIDVSGRPHRIVTNQESPIDRSGMMTHANVTLHVNNLTVLNDPSSYST